MPEETENNGEMAGEEYFRDRIKREQFEERKRREAEEKNDGKAAGRMMTGNPLTSGLLRGAWWMFIPSFGLSLIYIDIHFILNIVYGDMFFCKLGDEWKPPAAAAQSKYGNNTNLIEIMAAALLNLIFFFSGITITTLIGTIVYLFTHKLEAIQMLGTSIVGFLF